MTMNLQINLSKSQLLTASVLGSSLLFSGCQHTLKAPSLPPVTVTPEQPQAQQPDSTIESPQLESPTKNIDFSVTGKIGVRTPKQNGSAFYAWTQVNDRFAIDLTGAMGIGQTHIEGVPGQVTLNSSKTGLLSADTPEELLQQATGWQAPISYLVHWINAQPVESTAQTDFDPQKRLIKLQEGGWNVILNYNAAESLPNKLIMTQALEQGENRVTLTIQSRSEAVK